MAANSDEAAGVIGNPPHAILRPRGGALLRPEATLRKGMANNDRYWDCLDQAMEASHGGRTDEALAWLDEALRAQPDGAEAHNGRGEILWDEGKVDEAVHEFARALRADPKFITAHLNHAELLVEDLSEFEQAVALCDELLAGRAELPRLDRGTEGEVHYLKAKAVFYLDDLAVRNCASRVARPTHRTRRPVAIGSRVPACPTWGVSRIFRAAATMSWLVGPSGLSRGRTPAGGETPRLIPPPSQASSGRTGGPRSGPPG